MKRNTTLILIFLLCSTSLFSQATIPPYHQYTDFLFTSPGAFGNGLLGYVNPAVLNYVHGPDLRYIFSTDQGNFSSVDRWGLFLGVTHLSFGMIRQPGIKDYRVSFGAGSDNFSFGLGYGWSSGDTYKFNRDKLITIGSISRPNRFVSIGWSGIFTLHEEEREGILDVGFRPFGNDFLTLFSDFAWQTKDQFNDAKWSAGAALQLLLGIHLTGRYFDSEAFAVGLNFSLGAERLSTQLHFPENDNLGQVHYGIRLGAKEPNIFDPLVMKNKKYLSLNLKGDVKYQRYQLFDEDSHTLTGILSSLKGTIDDPTVAGVAINLTDMNVSPELAWEIREKLLQVQQAGKKVAVFLEQGGMTEYHLASVADRIILDPDGLLTLEGYLLGRTFQKDMLEKLGIGFDEWRFLKYKSAYEVYSRDQMSDPDREQRQALIDDLYAIVRSDICQSRNFTEQKFDELINDKLIFMAQDAVNAGLVDTLARWNDFKKIIKSFEGSNKLFIGTKALAQNTLPPRDWGAKPKIAIIYAIGTCEMERGIKARRLVKTFEKITKDANVKAVVFRVDSPGGELLASDIVAEAVKKCAEKKPVIISQGNVAGSGGYWISMNADTIVSAPFTITGSIGVIGGWLWNKELGDKLGLKSDYVKVGKHADLGFGIQLPLLGIQIPDRNLTTEERAMIERFIKTSYQEFVTKVATGRKLTAESVDEIAQGRVWSGTDAKEKGLVDVLGGLETSIILAKQAAGIPEEREIELIELPKLGLFDLSIFTPRLLGVEIPENNENYELQFLKLLAKYPGQPLPLLTPDYYPVTK